MCDRFFSSNIYGLIKKRSHLWVVCKIRFYIQQLNKDDVWLSSNDEMIIIGCDSSPEQVIGFALQSNGHKVVHIFSNYW
jgi:hypothetical protein